MNYKHILVTGGAGFVGSNICVRLKHIHPDSEITAFDNLYRKGSELNIPRLEKCGVTFVKGDVRDRKSLLKLKTDLIIECSAEPAVTAGVGGSPEYLIDTNLGGAINCFELARNNKADVIFLSTSRVYPYDGVYRSMYGATKLAAEHLLMEYIQTYGIGGIITRFGVIAGPWQFGRTDQGIVSHWLAGHVFDFPLSYIGYGGKGEQVRDILHIDDAVDLIVKQIGMLNTHSGITVDAGGGKMNAVTLKKLNDIVSDISGIEKPIGSVKTTRPNDVFSYVSDNRNAAKHFSWKPQKTVKDIVMDTYGWMRQHQEVLRPLYIQ